MAVDMSVEAEAQARNQLTERAEQLLTQLSIAHLHSAVDFINYLLDKEVAEEAAELKHDPEFMADMNQANQELEAGDVVPFEDIRRDV